MQNDTEEAGGGGGGGGGGGQIAAISAQAVRNLTSCQKLGLCT